MDVREIVNNLKSPSKSDIELITKAYDFAQKVHGECKRLSGEPYFVHLFETAKTLSVLKLDAPTIAAGLLHDVLEDSQISEKDFKREFGEEVYFLVKSVTKLKKIKFKGVKRHTESLRKFFMAMAKDIRVILIKIADRMHNMETLNHLPEEKQKRIAMNTLEIYAPIANRLGMGFFKGKLEDLAFPYVEPEEYKKLKKIAREKLKEGEKYLSITKRELEDELEKENIHPLSINKRIKRLWSLYKKLQKKEMNIDKIYDLAALRIIVNSVGDCYKVLGIIHKLWKPLPGKIRDYIALPKLNGYQSLHTTVFTNKGKIVEIQIRTKQMHEEAEYGIAAHWTYEELEKPKKGWAAHKKFSWVQQLLDWQKEISNPEDFLENLKIDFFQDRVFTLTPKGDVIDLPEGATPIDFAYAIHSDIGKSASGAKVNNKLVSFDSALKNGDIVEILTQKNKKPKAEWIKHAKTALARKYLRLSSKKHELISAKYSAKGIPRFNMLIKAKDRVGLLKDITAIFSEFRVNIENTSTKKEDGFRIVQIIFKPRGIRQIEKIKTKIGGIKKVKEISVNETKNI